MHNDQLNSIKSYTSKNGEIRFMFTIYLGLDTISNKMKNTTRRGYKTLDEAVMAYKNLAI